MKSLLEQVTSLDELIRQLHKIESKMRSGQIIDAWRGVCSMIGSLNQSKKDLLDDADK